jgi:metal transporter CNNM
MESEKPLPLVFALGTTFVLVCCSAFCSGLTLGLMGLDLTMLQVILESGSEIDKKRAAKITPLRSTGNRLLCVLLITNTAVNAGLAIVMAGFTGGFEGFVLSTLLIMIFGEITPQAICSRHGLAIGAFLYPVIWTVCWAFFPLAYPIAQVLDLVLGSEIGLSYSRDELIALLAMHSIGGRTKQGPAGDIHDTEAKILQGVLKFSGKTAEDVYTPLRHVGMLGMHEVFNLKG